MRDDLRKENNYGRKLMQFLCSALELKNRTEWHHNCYLVCAHSVSVFSGDAVKMGQSFTYQTACRDNFVTKLAQVLQVAMCNEMYQVVNSLQLLLRISREDVGSDQFI